jgi:hypothetical protein
MLHTMESAGMPKSAESLANLFLSGAIASHALVGLFWVWNHGPTLDRWGIYGMDFTCF